MILFLANLLLSAVVLLVTSRIAPGFTIDTFTTALIAALLLGIMNAIIRPLLLLLTLPINIVTLGLFTLIINGLMLWLVANIVSGVHIATFGDAVFAGIILWILNWATNMLTNRNNAPQV